MYLHRKFAVMAVLTLAIAVAIVVSDAHAAQAMSYAMPFGGDAFSFSVANVLALGGVAADLRGKRAKAVDDFDALVTKMNADDYVDDPKDQASYDTLKSEIDGYDVKINRAVEAAKAKATTAVVVPGQTAAKVYALPKRRYGKLTAFKGTLEIDGKEMDAEERAYRSGMFILASLGKLSGEEKQQVARQWCIENGLGPFLKAQAEGVNTAGGFLVPTEFETAIIDLREEYGTFRRECRLVPMGSDAMTIPRRSSGVTAYWVGENSAITESQKGWDQVQLSAKKLAALSRMSTELAEDAVISIADDLAQEMGYAFAVAEDAAGWTGDGTSTYGGIRGLKTKLCGTIGSGQLKGAMDAASGHDTFAEIDATDLSNLMGLLPKYAERNAKWYCSMPAWNVVFQRLMAAAGGTTLTELSGGKPNRSYLGYPVVLDQTLPTSTGDLSDLPMLYFGDLSLGARMGERRGIRVKTSDDRYFEYDQIGIQATERVDVNVHDVGDTSTAGPIVALIGE
jgi:HK97 family phage major capsid protein